MNRGQDRRGEREERGRQERIGVSGSGKQQQRGESDQQGGDGKKQERPKRESIIDLSKFVDKRVRVKFQGGREATGKLKGYDQFLNLVLDDTVEYLRDTDDSYKVTDTTRNLGLVVCRGPAVTIVCPQDGHNPIQNPFLMPE